MGTYLRRRDFLGGQAQRPSLRAGFAPPDELVRVECDPDGGHERERAERTLREQVERGAAAEGERRDRVELVTDGRE